MRNLRLIFTSDGVGVGVVIRSVKLYDLVKTAFWFFWFRLRHYYDSVVYDQLKTGSSELQAEAEQLLDFLI